MPTTTESSSTLKGSASLPPQAPGSISPAVTRSRKVRIVEPYSRHLHCRVRAEDQHLEIGSFLNIRFPFRSRNEWDQRLDSGWVTQGPKKLSAGEKISNRLPLTIFHPWHTEPSVPDEVSVLQTSDDYLLVYKPAPMPVHPGGRYNKNTLTSILQATEPWVTGSTAPHVLHRLDSVTSGIVLLGRTHDFSRRVQKAFSEGTVEKAYLAVVNGTPREDFVVIDTPVGRKSGYIFECTQNGKPSVTHIQVLKRAEQTSLVVCRPQTGRTHQIRLHLLEWGYPVMDDTVYGPAARQCYDSPVSSGRTGADFKKIIPMQNREISLLHCQMRFPDPGLHFRLPESFIHSFFSDPGRSEFRSILTSETLQDLL